MTQHPFILVVDDNSETLSFLRDVLSQEGYEVDTSKSAQAALRKVAERSPDLILSDIHMPDLDGLSFLSELRSRHHEMPVILMTAYGSLKTAVDGLQAGAFDYLSKPLMVEDVRLVVHRALEHSQVSRHNQQLKDQLRDHYGFDNLVGSSPALVQGYKSIARGAPTDSTGLLPGSGGPG